MKIIICGAGQVGGQIARHLSREEVGNTVTVIDFDAGLVRRLTDAYDVGGIVGFASHPDILERAGARDADMIIAATQSDEVNMVVCQVANSIFSVPRKIARLRAPAYLNAIYSDLYRQDHLPIDVVISPEYAVAEAVMQRMAAPAAFDIEGFLDNTRPARRRRARRDLPGAQHAAAPALGAVLDAARRRRRHPPRRPAVRARGRGPALRRRPGLCLHRDRGPAADDGDLRQDRDDGRAGADRRRRQHRPPRRPRARGRRRAAGASRSSSAAAPAPRRPPTR